MNVLIRDVRHLKLCYCRKTYCGHPRQGGIFYFGNGEVAVIHNHAPCAYQKKADVAHDYGGYHSRSVALLQRSTDWGETWPQERNLEIWDESAPYTERRQRLFQDGVGRGAIDMSRPESVFYFGRSWSGEIKEDGKPTLVCFALRSADKGKTWENVTTIVTPPPGLDYVHKDGHPVVQMPDGTFLAAMSASGGDMRTSGIYLYGSDDDGLTWEYVAPIALDPTGFGRSTYAGLILVPTGRLLCFGLNISGRGNFVFVSHSDDGGYTWSDARPIVHWGDSPWRDLRPAKQYRHGVFYRSPWPMLLRDDRILVLFARRKPPFGIGGIVSEDHGEKWSSEFVLRADASKGDIGYPVAVQFEDGRVFAAYYYMTDDGNNFGGTRFIAGSFFRLKNW